MEHLERLPRSGMIGYDLQRFEQILTICNDLKRFYMIWNDLCRVLVQKTYGRSQSGRFPSLLLIKHLWSIEDTLFALILNLFCR